MTKLERKLISYANITINNKCEITRPSEVCYELLDFGFTKAELLKMGFDDYVIDEQIKELLHNNKEE